MVTVSGGSRTVTVQYLDMVRKSVRSVQIRTCTNGPIAVIGHTLVFSPAALNAKGNGIAEGTALYIPTCGVRPNPVVVLVTSVRLGLGIVAATTQLLSDSGVFPLKAVFPRGEICGPVRLNSTDRLIKNGYLHENVSLNGCSGVDGSADVRAHLQLTIDGKWGGLGASFSNALHDRLPLPFTTLSLKLQATQSSNLVVLADRTASCTYPITLAEVDLGEWPVDLGIPLTIDPKLEFDAALTVTGAVQASFVAEERFGDTAIVSLAHPKPHVVSSHKLSSKTSSFVATLQSVKVALTPRLESILTAGRSACRRPSAWGSKSSCGRTPSPGRSTVGWGRANLDSIWVHTSRKAIGPFGDRGCSLMVHSIRRVRRRHPHRPRRQSLRRQPPRVLRRARQRPRRQYACASQALADRRLAVSSGRW